MRLVVDANILVAELLRRRGRALVASPALVLFMAEAAWSEATHELRRRARAIARRSGLAEATVAELLDAAFAVVDSSVTVVPYEGYAATEAQARRRVPRDAGDWPTVGLALVLEAGTWTQDRDFLGCGVPTWTTDTLARHLEGGEPPPGG